MKKGARIGFGIANVAVAVVLAWTVFRLLPGRWWVVDSGAAVASGTMLVSGLALLANHRLAPLFTRIAAGLALALGLATVLALALAASWLWGTYGQVGRGGATLFFFVCTALIPYLVVLPAVELVWVGPKR